MAEIVDPQPLINAIKAAIAAQGVAVGVAKKPVVAAGLPWVVMWPDGGAITNRSMASRDGFLMVLALHCFGLSPDSAWVALRKARVGVTGMANAVVAGRGIQVPIPLESLPPISRDDDVDPPLFMQYDEWRIQTS